MKYVCRFFTGFAAAAAVFTIVCITNPALAANIPLIGNIFEEIGNSLGFSGDYGDYAKPLEQDNVNLRDTDKTAEEERITKSGEESAYSKTVDGVTVTLSEEYCNDEALYISMLIESDEPIPDTEMMNDSPVLDISDSDLQLSYNKDYQLLNAYLDGKMLDDHTYAGVLRVDMDETSRDTEGEILEIPDKFSADLIIHNIRGRIPYIQDGMREVPEELKNSYTQAMAENGLEEADYEKFTLEEKELERQLFSDIWNQYHGFNQEASIDRNDYSSWHLKGDWEFSLNIERDYTKNVKMDVNLLDEEGYGVISVTKTPFEIALEVQDPEARYVPVVMDAHGELMSAGGKFGGSGNMIAIQNSDVSSISIYLCDYLEYMDELKGYYWSDDYEKNKKTKTFQQLLQEKALMWKEIKFNQ